MSWDKSLDAQETVQKVTNTIALAKAAAAAEAVIVANDALAKAKAAAIATLPKESVGNYKKADWKGKIDNQTSVEGVTNTIALASAAVKSATATLDAVKTITKVTAAAPLIEYKETEKELTTFFKENTWTKNPFGEYVDNDNPYGIRWTNLPLSIRQQTEYYMYKSDGTLITKLREPHVVTETSMPPFWETDALTTSAASRTVGGKRFGRSLKFKTKGGGFSPEFIFLLSAKGVHYAPNSTTLVEKDTIWVRMSWLKTYFESKDIDWPLSEPTDPVIEWNGGDYWTEKNQKGNYWWQGAKDSDIKWGHKKYEDVGGDKDWFITSKPLSDTLAQKALEMRNAAAAAAAAAVWDRLLDNQTSVEGVMDIVAKMKVAETAAAATVANDALAKAKTDAIATLPEGTVGTYKKSDWETKIKQQTSIAYVATQLAMASAAAAAAATGSTATIVASATAATTSASATATLDAVKTIAKVNLPPMTDYNKAVWEGRIDTQNSVKAVMVIFAQAKSAETRATATVAANALAKAKTDAIATLPKESVGTYKKSDWEGKIDNQTSVEGVTNTIALASATAAAAATAAAKLDTMKEIETAAAAATDSTATMVASATAAAKLDTMKEIAKMMLPDHEDYSKEQKESHDAKIDEASISTIEKVMSAAIRDWAPFPHWHNMGYIMGGPTGGPLKKPNFSLFGGWN